METGGKMSAPFMGFSHTEETKAKMSISHTGKSHTGETKAKISSSHPKSQKVIVRDVKTGKTENYNTVRSLCKSLALSSGSVSKYLQNKSTKPFKGRYEISVVD